jgi:cyclohexadienyl dehydratase
MPKTPLSFYLHMIAVAVIVFAIGSYVSSRAERSGVEGSYTAQDPSTAGLRPSAQDDKKESAYDRVMRTKTLRCAYIVYPPETIKDPNTKVLSGTVVDNTEEVGRQLGWKIDWVEEVGFTDMFAGLESGRYDALCTGLFENPMRAQKALFSMAVNFGLTYAFVGHNDVRFDADLKIANNPDFKIAVIDGEIAEFIAKEMFPQATLYRLPNLSDISMVLESIATGKADIAFLQRKVAGFYIKQNPDKIKILDQPVRLFASPLLAVNKGENQLIQTIDSAIRTMHLNGFIETTLRKYDPELQSYALVAKPYQLPAN